MFACSEGPTGSLLHGGSGAIHTSYFLSLEVGVLCRKFVLFKLLLSPLINVSLLGLGY